jgi:tetratricopeptide (TPR) repeat protein
MVGNHYEYSIMKLEPKNFWKNFDDIKDLSMSGKRKEALTELDLLLRENEGLRFSSYFLVERSILIQIQDEMDDNISKAKGWTLEDAEKNLRDAIAIDPSSIRAPTELGYFLFVINDKAKEALGHFERAIRNCNDFLEKAFLGKIKCILELEGAEEANKLLARAEDLFPDSERFIDIKTDILHQLRQ